MTDNTAGEKTGICARTALVWHDGTVESTMQSDVQPKTGDVVISGSLQNDRDSDKLNARTVNEALLNVAAESTCAQSHVPEKSPK